MNLRNKKKMAQPATKMMVLRNRSEMGTVQEKNEAYNLGLKFWLNQEANNKGVLLGHEHLDKDDLSFSRKILKRYLNKMVSPCAALDCGAGIGRVTKGLLSKCFE